jgi:uncharacterized membrane protein
MNQVEFLSQLKRALGGLAEQEKTEILADYEEHFRMAREAGKSDEQISQSLGNPRVLGRSYRVDSLLEEGRAEGKVSAVVRAIFASLSLGFFNIVVVLAPFIALLAVIVSLWTVAVSLALSGVCVILALIASPFLPGFINLGGVGVPFLIFSSIGVSALGLLAVIGMWFLTRWFVFAVATYAQFNARIIMNRR